MRKREGEVHLIGLGLRYAQDALKKAALGSTTSEANQGHS
jgi:hypothetical protein